MPNNYHKTGFISEINGEEGPFEEQDLNHGRIVERAVRRKSMGISEIARKVGVSRRTLYNWFEMKEMNPEIVSKIGEVISNDFSGEFPEAFFKGTTLFGTGVTDGPVPSTPGNSKNPAHYWMSRYIELLERYHEMLIRQRNS